MNTDHLGGLIRSDRRGENHRECRIGSAGSAACPLFLAAAPLVVLSPPQRCECGFTVTEVLLVVAVVGVLLAVAAPSLNALFVNNRLDTAANEFMTSLNFARSEAIRRGVTVRVERVQKSGFSSRDWTPGWRVRLDSTDEILREVQQLAAPMTLYSEEVTDFKVYFYSSGSRQPSGGTPVTDRVFLLCYASEVVSQNLPRTRSRAVIISAAGTVRLAPTNANGNPLRPPYGGSLDPYRQDAITKCTTPGFTD